MQSLRKEKTVIVESKVRVPRGVIGKKPRERRAYKKEKKKMLEQVTEHFSLRESLGELDYLAISSPSQSIFEGVLIKKEGRVVPYSQVLSQQEISMLASTRRLPESTKTHLLSQGYTTVSININDNLSKSLLFLSNLSTQKQKLNIIIQPQSQTQNLIPYTLHLNKLINTRKNSRRRGNQPEQVRQNISLIKLHGTLRQEMRGIDVRGFIDGVVKGNQKEQYALGYQALRLWTVNNDKNLGDRIIEQKDINAHMGNILSLRKIFWDLLPLLPSNPTHPKTSSPPKLYLSKFMMDCIDSYISHMQLCYKQLNLNQAYILTYDFFQNIVYEIYTKTVKKKIITYPNLQENQEHFEVIKRIMELLAVINPIFPFSAYHVAKMEILKWPEIVNPYFYQDIPLHNEMIRLRVKVINKLRLNRLDHAQMYIDKLSHNFTTRDLELFFNIDKVSTDRPESEYNRQCSLKLNKENNLSGGERLIFYAYDEHCVRCDPGSKQRRHLCGGCYEYLRGQVDEPLRYFQERERGRVEGQLQ